MEGSVDAAGFLRSIPPFDALPVERFEEAARGAVERRIPAGTWLAHAGGEPMQHLFVIREGSVRLERHGQTVQVLEEGEAFGYTSLITGKAIRGGMKVGQDPMTAAAAGWYQVLADTKLRSFDDA